MKIELPCGRSIRVIEDNQCDIPSVDLWLVESNGTMQMLCSVEWTDTNIRVAAFAAAEEPVYYEDFWKAED